MTGVRDTYLFVLPSGVLGGAETVTRRLAINRATEGAQVHILIMVRGGRHEDWDGIPNCNVWHVNARREAFAVLPTIRRIRAISKSCRLRVAFGTHVHVNGLLGVLRRLNLLAADWLILRESTVFGDRWSGIRMAAVRFFYSCGYTRADLVVCQTHYMAGLLRKTVSDAERWNIAIIPNPIDLEDIERRSTPLPESAHALSPYIVSAGRLIDVKGYDILLQGFAALPKQFSHLKLIILGDGPERERLQCLARELAIEPRVFIQGRVKNPIPYFVSAAACVVSSLREGFPNVLLEMMAANARVVSTACAGDMHELDGVFLCDPGNPTALCEALTTALRSTPRQPNLRSSLRGRTPNETWARIGQALPHRAHRDG